LHRGTGLLVILFLRGAVLALLTQKAGWRPEVALLGAALVAAAANYSGSVYFIFPISPDRPDPKRALIATLGVVAYAMVLRLCYTGLLELIPEEAYYWNYAQHPDIGYLDHPPMVAWLIWLGTSVFGNNEFAVRFGAVACWLTAAFFCYRLTANMFDKPSALRAVVLMIVLPFFFCVGLLMTPDAPLVACWAAALYFLERALLGERCRAWWGVGAAIGLGMLSKYTILLLGPVTAVFVLADARSRRWLGRPEPYAAALLAILLFAPVIVWNAANGWASFVFQGPARIARAAQFSLHTLLGGVILLLGPLGAAGVVKQLLPSTITNSSPSAPVEALRRRRFALIFVVVPLSAFIFFALAHRTKLNWTGPVWLAALPALAWDLRPRPIMNGLSRWGRKLWRPGIAAMLVIYGCGLHYLALGLPGVDYPDGFSLIGWRDLGHQVRQREELLNAQTRTRVVVVGMDKYNLASEMAFYRHVTEDGPEHLPARDSVASTTGRHLFGRDSLMYRFWSSKRRYEGRTLLLVGRDADDLLAERLAPHFDRLGPVRQIAAMKNGKPAGRYYYRIGYGFRSRLVSGS